jgi:hypothetical protein
MKIHSDLDFSWVVGLAESSRANGCMLWSSGAKSFGERIGTYQSPAKWQHTIFPPLEDRHLKHIGIDFGLRFQHPYLELILNRQGPNALRDQLRISMGIKFSWPQIHESYAALLQCTNGCQLFANELGLFGIAFEKKLVTDLQPWPLDTPNLFELQSGRQTDEIVIGSRQSDGSKLFQDVYSGIVVRRVVGNPAIVNQWASLQHMLSDEVKRIESMG